MGSPPPSAGSILGVVVTDLTMHPDSRGAFTELFRESWDLDVSPIQWNVVRSEEGVLRGVHVHPRHDDYLSVLTGRATVGLRDLRSGSPTEGLADLVELSGDQLRSIVIPHGVAHGFLFHEPSLHMYSVSHYWDTDDELGCLWSDPALEIPWPFSPSDLSKKDTNAQSLGDLLIELESYQPI